MLYASLHYLFHGRNICIYVGTIICGCVGYFFSKIHLDCPFYLDSSLTCMPFVAFGNIIRNETQLLYVKTPKYLCIRGTVILLLLTYMLCRENESLF